MKPPRKKILYLITKSNWGGAQRYVFDLVTHLNKDKFEVVVALGGTGILYEQLKHAGIKTISIASLERDITLKKELLFIRELWKIISKEKPEIIHLNSSKVGILGSIISRLKRVPLIIFTAHGWFFNENRPKWQKISSKTLHWITVLVSSKTIAVSTAVSNQMNWWGAQKKMKVIHPGRCIGVMFDRKEAREFLSNTGDEELQKLKTNSYLWIGTIAELHPVKQIDVLIKSIKILRNHGYKVCCLVMGTGSEKDKLTALIKHMKLQKCVFLLGHIPDAARYLHALDIFVLPSHSEAYGYVVHEAGLARLPVIASNVGGIPDIIKHNESGILVPSGDEQAIAKAIQKLKKNYRFTEKIRHNLKQSLQKRTVEIMTHSTEKMYEK